MIIYFLIDLVFVKGVLIFVNDELNLFEDKFLWKFLNDLEMFEMKICLVFYFEEYGLEERFLEVFDLEKIDGKVFGDCDMDDFNRLFLDMLYGDKKRFFNIKIFILKEELLNGLIFENVFIGYKSLEDNENINIDYVG